MELAAVIIVIGVALAFDYVNGFHDAANSIATVVSTRVLSPRIAVAWAAFFNFVAFLIFGTHVAATIATGVVEPDVLSIGVVFAGLIGAIGWNLVTFYLGLPSSSSHALVGGIAGAAVAKGGFAVLVSDGLRTIGVFIILSPLVGLALGMLLMITMLWAVHRYRNVERTNRGFRTGQLFSAAAFSLGHGGNDAQKTMGIILAVLIAAGHLPLGAGGPPLGRAVGPHRHRTRHPHRRLAHREDDGFEDHPVAAGRWGGGGVGGGRHALLHLGRRHPGVDHAHHHRRHRRRRRQPGVVGRALGCRRPRGLGVGADDPRSLGDRRAHLWRGGGAVVSRLRLTDRRAAFFLFAALLGALLIPIADPQHRWVAVAVTITYTLLAAASALDKRTRDKVQPRYSKRQ